VLSWIGRYPYRCYRCGFRFYPGDVPSKAPAVEQANENVPEKPPQRKRHKKSGTQEWIDGTRKWRQNRRLRWRREFLFYGLAVLAFLLFLRYVSRDHNGAASE
jgi:hypothetical protein